ncbi:MAG: peptidoglycan DD-metalloendopeptidase family protein [Candidatus Cloacimonadales bacterium]|jgi:septal ring factor EnvC (AmiA/AmiB activator)|nr:peptidoglycan DD-metalloendopeptidase family protein [Candidatus Cloacimonadota bacterium]HCX60035.1 metalloendopeptidase [Candidatus Cloacimonas sp.]MCK9434153.1 peptidoglycan DD-metalloendopeptidase family protein [Candidatus Cloacimonadota bacterium]MDD2615865.1 peptidoglycan DD-metalloendopeptidase family protein [Candidatus Cloacimonadota bacterium]MDD3546892.1 peptidoglycan DD-metalloendopeptidase family protein [Candidatus Cloacimonadota bacterium]
MAKKLINILLMLSIVLLFADDLDDKVRELQRLQSQLESAEAKAKQTAEKKQKTSSEIQRSSSLKKLADRNINLYKSAERVVRDSLSQLEQRLSTANDRLGSLHNAQNAELNVLMRVDRSYATRRISHRDHRYLQSLVLQHKQDVDILNGYKVSLMQAQDIHSAEAARINRDLRKESQKSRNLNKNIRNLNTQIQKLSKEEQDLHSRIATLKRDAAALESLIAQLMEESGTDMPTYEFTQIKIAWPVKGKIIRNFGEETRNYNTSIVSNGIDIAVPEGTNVVAVDDGVVVFSGRYGGQGKLIIIDHQNGFFSLYAYNSDLLVQKDAEVKRGQVIARSGMTGSASQASLHFELRKKGVAVNPIPYFKQ